ncbi:hypothetical protein PLICRDRAFT_100856 [Plicaturopsis crispa FD-325 SS-3]|nr:hypothetical protein PLICRDRAFT_100856 [Plicaturopsis crispa FD-325 SS-3]
MDEGIDRPNVRQEVKGQHDGRTRPASLSSTVLLSPFRLLTSILRPITPQLIPIIVCILFIPLVAFFSIFAGWFVWRSVAVAWEVPVYLNYGDGVPPYAEFLLPNLVLRQPYDVSLHLQVPASESNYALGNFMTSLTISTSSNTTVASIRRPTLVLPSPSRRWLSTSPNVINVNIPLLSSYIPRNQGLVGRVELGRRDSWRTVGKGEGRELSVLSASLRGAVKHHGVRGLVTIFPLTFAVVSSITFFVIAMLVLTGCILSSMSLHLHRDARGPPPAPPHEQAVKPPPSDDDSEDEKPARRRRRTRGSASRRQSRSVCTLNFLKTWC